MTLDPQRAKSLFLAALEHASDERGAFLDEACAGNPDLRRRVDQLLQAHDRPDSLPEAPAVPGPTEDSSPPKGGDAVPGPVAATEVAGTVIGPYKLLEPIGEGGMGTVWMAQQTEPVKRLVALKLIKAGMDSAQVIARFEAERQALALMDHANIAKVLDGGATSAGRPYFVMDLVKGVPITRYCDEHHLTPRQRLELFLPVCLAVQHAHQKGIIHRDLKPSNVLVALYDGKPVPKVIDFGVAKAAGQSLTEKTLVTGFGVIVGTLEYMSPEQAEINQLDIDTRSDIYSLGVLLYELLTGSPPFSRLELEKAGMLEMLRVIREQEPAKPSTKLSTAEGLPTLAANRGMEPAKLTKLVRGELDWIVMKALEKDRNRRYETANGFAMDVQRYLADEPVLACPPSVGYRLRKFARRNKGPVLAASLVLAALVIAIVGTTWGMIRATHAEADAVREAGEKTVALGDKETALATAKTNELEAHRQGNLAKDNAKTAREQELLAHRRFHAAQTNLAQQAWEAGQPARTLELLESLRPKLDREDLRGFEWYYLWRLCHRHLHRILSGPRGEAVSTLAITPDGKTLVSGSLDSSLRVWDVTTGTERAMLTGHTSQICRLAISPDGKMAASASFDHTVKLWDLGTSELLATLTGRTDMVRSVAFSPDGKTLAVGTEMGTLELWDVGARKRRLTLPAHSAPAIALAYSPDGKMLATGAGWKTNRGPGGVKVWEVTSEPPRIVFQAPDTLCVAFSPDCKLLATCGSRGAKVWGVPSGELKGTFDSLNSSVQSVAFSVDGNTVVLGGNDRTVKLWEFATGATRTVGVHLGAVNAVAFFPQGDLLASGSNDGIVKLWHADPPPDAASFTPKSASRAMAFTPDSKLLVLGSNRPTTVLDAATGKETTTLPVGGVLAVSADANLLAGSAPGDKGVIWDVAAARARAVLPVGPNLSGAAFARDGKTLVTWSADPEAPERSVRLWDLATSRVRLMLKLVAWGQIYSAAFSPDGRTLATGHQFGAVTLWDPTTGEQRMTLQPAEVFLGALAVAFSNDGKMLAAGNYEGTLRLWNVETGQLKVSFKGHIDAIKSVAFAPDDRTLLSGSTDRTARLWDVVTGQELLTLKGHESPVTLVAFAPDGKRVATASHNAVQLWLAATEPEATAFRMEIDPDDSDSPRADKIHGDRLRDAGRIREAEQAYRRAMPRLEQLARAFPGEPAYAQELAASHLGLSFVLRTGGFSAEARLAHDRAMSLYEQVAVRFPKASDSRGMLAFGYYDLGGKLGAMKRSGEAELAFRQAVELYEKLVVDSPTNARHQYMLSSGNYQLSLASAAADRPGEAEALLSRALAPYERLASAFPDVASYRTSPVAMCLNVGTALQTRGHLAAAENTLRQGLRLARKLLDESPDTEAYQLLVAQCCVKLAEILTAGGKLPEAANAYQQIVELTPTSAAAHNYLGGTLRQKGKADEAIAACREAIRLKPDHAGAHATLGVILRDGKRDYEGAIVYFNKAIELDRKQASYPYHLGNALRDQNKHDDAIVEYRKAIERNAKSVMAYYGLASALQANKDPDGAIAAYRQALEALGPAHPEAPNIQNQLANLYQSRGNLPESIRLFEQVRDQRLEKLGPNDTVTISSMNELGVAYWRARKLDQSIPLFEETVRLSRANRRPDDPATYTSIANLGVNYRDAGRLREALPLLEEVVEWVRKQPAPVASRLAWVTRALVETYEQDQQFGKAEPFHREALQRVQKQFGAADPRTAGSLASLGLNLLQQRKFADAERFVRECLALREKAEPDAWTTFNARSMLGGCLLAAKKYAEAEPLLRQGYEGMKQREATIPPLGKPRLREAIERLVQLYDARGKPEQSAPWRKQLEEHDAGVIADFKKAIALDPNNAPLHLQLGLTLEKQGKLDEAIPAFRQAIELYPKDANSYRGLALTLLTLKRPDYARDRLQKAAEKNPNAATACMILGGILLDHKKPDEAAACFQRAVELGPHSAESYYLAGITLLENSVDQRNVDQAAAFFEKGVELDSAHVLCRWGLGRARQRQKRLDEAVGCFHACLKLDPNHLSSLWSLGFALLDQQKPDEALVYFRKAVALNPNHSYAQYGLGRALMQQKQPEEAIAAFRKSIELDPKRADAHYHLGVLLRQQNQSDDALACFRKTIQLNLQNGAAHGHLGSILAIQGKTAEGMAFMRKALELNPKLAGSHTDLAWQLATAADPKLRDPKAAVHHARTATELQPNQPDHWRNFGVALLRDGDNQAAAEALEKFEEMTKGIVHHHRFFLAMAYWQLGEKDKARQAFERAVQWMDKAEPKNGEQLRFRAEAAELLKIDEKKSKPPDSK